MTTDGQPMNDSTGDDEAKTTDDGSRRTDGRHTKADGGHATTDSEFATPSGAGTDTEDGHGLPPLGSVRRYLVTTNHKDVGVLYIVTALFFLIFGGVLALLMRLQLWTAGQGILSAGAYNQAVSIHGG